MIIFRRRIKSANAFSKILFKNNCANLSTESRSRTFPLEFFNSVIMWLGSSMKVESASVTLSLRILSKIALVYSSRGNAECIKYSKELRFAILNFLNNDEENPPLPKILRPYKRYLSKIDRNYPLIRIILSCTYSTRFIRLPISTDISTITNGPSYTGTPSVSRSDIRRFLVKGLGVNPIHLGRVPRKLAFKEFHMSTKSGPNGISLWSSFWDIWFLPCSTQLDLIILGGPKLGSLMDRYLSLFCKIPHFFIKYSRQIHKGRLRKLSGIQDKEGKTRWVAILDYFSQSALRPLHLYLFSYMSKINQDCTFDQTKLLKSLKPRKGSKFHSIDLSAATDRFPIAIQEEILSVWFGREYAEAWTRTMIGLPFEVLGRSVYYGVGNPMGAYSSWSAFVLAHHFFVFLACKKARVNWKRCPYMLLGDDIVIADDKVAMAYLELLALWGIPYNATKTHTSSNLFEFAKQFVVDGVNVSPFPIAALFERRRSIVESVFVIVRELTFKDWDVDMWASLRLYLKRVKRFSEKHLKSLYPKLKLSIALMFYFQGQSDLGTALKEYVAEYTSKEVTWSKYLQKMYSQFIAGNVITDLYRDSVHKITSKSNRQPLGSLAIELTMAITSLREGGADCFDLIEAVPFLQIYGRAEETFLRIQKPSIGARLITSGPQMKAILDVVDIPTSDRDFYVRNRDVIVIKSIKSSKIIVDYIKRHMKQRASSFNRNPILPSSL